MRIFRVAWVNEKFAGMSALNGKRTILKNKVAFIVLFCCAKYGVYQNRF